jgi:hypothetical protein
VRAGNRSSALNEAESERSARVAVVTGGVGKSALSSYSFMQHRGPSVGGSGQWLQSLAAALSAVFVSLVPRVGDAIHRSTDHQLTVPKSKS